MASPDAIIDLVFAAEGKRFVLWRHETRDGGKRTKVPVKVTGHGMARSNDPRTWGTLRQAREGLMAGGFDGIGIMLGEVGDGISLIGLDLDLCRNLETGEIADWAQRLIQRFDTYGEVSPSGTGVKLYLLVRGKLPGERREVTVDAPVPPGAEGSGHSAPEIGLYPNGRYFAVTGLHVEGTPLEIRDCTDAAFALAKEMDGTGERKPARAAAKVQWPAVDPETGEVVTVYNVNSDNEPADLPASVKALLAADPTFAAAWQSGDKIGVGKDHSSSGRDFSLTCWLAERDIDDEDIGAALRAYPHGQIGSGRLKGRRGERRIERILAEIQKSKGNDDPRPVIRIAGGRLHQEVERAERELGKAGGVYQRGSVLVRVARINDPSSGGIRRASNAVVIVPMDRSTMRMTLTEVINWQRLDRRSDEWVPVNCSGDHADALLAATGNWPSIEPLLGIIEAPTLRPDGSILDQPGYDPESGLYFHDGGLTFPPVPREPSRADADAALALLREPLKEIPFKSDADRSVALAFIITGLVRRSLRSAPAFAFTAPKMGAGKTLTATVGSYIATGRAPAMMSQADDAESERKRLFAILLEGTAIAVIDNVERAFASDALCSILTEPSFKDRVLGVSRTASAPTCTTWAVTGNNITVAGDLTTRMLVARIDPECERPEEREFKVNLHEEVPKRRAELAVAALTVIRAYLAAGAPRQQVPTFGRFEAWQEWCRFPLLWLGCADPCETRTAIEARDPVRERLAELAEAWEGVFGADEVTLADAVKEAVKDLPLVRTTADDAKARLREALAACAGEGSGINTRKLGWFLSKAEGRIEGGRRFVKGEERRAGVVWRVNASAGFAGFAGSRQPPTRDCQISISDTYIETAGEKPRNPQNPQMSASGRFRVLF